MYTPHSEKTTSFVKKLYYKDVAKQVFRNVDKYGNKIKVNDKIFPSIGSAAAFIGVCRSTVRRNLEKGNNKINGYDVSYVEEYKVKHKKSPVKVSVNGRIFHSISIAAGFMNISCSCLSIQLQNGVTSYLGYEINYGN